MRIGVWIDDNGRSLDGLVTEAVEARQAGIGEIWLGQRDGWDVLTALGIIGREVRGLAVGVAIARMYPQHPMALAGQALTVQAATAGRFTLGLGTSHRPIVEQRYGYAFERPARFAREYLELVMPLLRGDSVAYRGEALAGAGAVSVPGAAAPPVLLAAHGPAMLRLAGGLADGAIITWAGPRVVGEHVRPSVDRAAHAAGRPSPRVLVSTLISVTADRAARRAQVAETYGIAETLPSYRETLGREGVRGVADVALVGPPAAVLAGLHALADAGATDLIGIPFGTPEERLETLRLLGEWRTGREPVPQLGTDEGGPSFTTGR